MYSWTRRFTCREWNFKPVIFDKDEKPHICCPFKASDMLKLMTMLDRNYVWKICAANCFIDWHRLFTTVPSAASLTFSSRPVSRLFITSFGHRNVSVIWEDELQFSLEREREKWLVKYSVCVCVLARINSLVGLEICKECNIQGCHVV